MPADVTHPSPSPAVLTLSRDEMRARALIFAKRWNGAQREEADAKSFLDEFFDIFGRDRHAVDAVHEYRVERPERGEGRIDLLWPGKLLVEMKSTGRDLSTEKGGAAYQAFDYVPIGYLDPSTIPSNKLYIIAEPNLFLFGCLNARMHMAWMRTVGGRLESRYQYSGSVVYNTFPWPEPDAKERAAIEKAAQAVLDARAPRLAAGASLADLYDPLTMPADLLKAHQALDHAVDKAYRPAGFHSERERVEFLFARYEKLSAPLAPAGKPAKKPRKSL